MIDPENFCIFAEDLIEFHNLIGRYQPSTSRLNNTNPECVLRTIIDRSYYAAFLTARNWLEIKDNVQIPRYNAHKTVINGLKKSPTLKKNGIKISNRLFDLKKQRENASYEINYNFNMNQTMKIFNKSKKTIKMFPPLSP